MEYEAKQIERGFTLTEMLVVMAVIATLASILFPTIVSARREGQRTVGLSNLHQCGVALTLYTEGESNAASIPPKYAVDDTLRNAPTCDPRDDWRRSCAIEFGDPMVGSYAYVRKVSPFDEESGWSWYSSLQSNPTVMVSIFHGSHRVAPFHGTFPPDAVCVADQESCYVPDRVLRLFLDTSAKSTPVQRKLPDGSMLTMNFAHVFSNDTLKF